jgi:predicted membrane protein (TIGR00267 family)
MPVVPSDLIPKLQQLITISRSLNIFRRYFVVNGFDGALTTLGLLIGFYITGESNLKIVVTACLSAAIALAMSGFSSAYVSEAAERKRELQQLQDAMVADLSKSTHAKASRWIPLMIASVNGLSPFLMSLIIIVPVGLASLGITLVFDPYLLSIGLAFVLIFLLGVFLGKVSGTFWLLSGAQTLLIALITSFLIYLIA